MFRGVHRIPACERRTDRQIDGHTSRHGIVRAVRTRRAVKAIQDTTTVTVEDE